MYRFKKKKAENHQTYHHQYSMKDNSCLHQPQFGDTKHISIVTDTPSPLQIESRCKSDELYVTTGLCQGERECSFHRYRLNCVLLRWPVVVSIHSRGVRWQRRVFCGVHPQVFGRHGHRRRLPYQDHRLEVWGEDRTGGRRTARGTCLLWDIWLVNRFMNPVDVKHASRRRGGL